MNNMGLLEDNPDDRSTWTFCLRRLLSPFLIFLTVFGLLYFLLLVLICFSQVGLQPKIWNVLMLAPAAVGLGNLLGFLYGTFGDEEQKFKPVFAVFNGLIGGAALADLAKENGVIRGFFGAMAFSCGIPDGSGFLLVVIVPFFAVGFLMLYPTKVLMLNPLTRLANPEWAETKKAFVNQGVGGKYRTPPAMAAPGSQPSVPDDPQKNQWGAQPEANGRRLSATVDCLPGQSEWFRVRLRVESTDPAHPLKGTVCFHLHPTFRNTEPIVEVVRGVAEYVVVAWGAFTVGAEADDGQTKLELDLADLPQAPREFRSQ